MNNAIDSCIIAYNTVINLDISILCTIILIIGAPDCEHHLVIMGICLALHLLVMNLILLIRGSTIAWQVFTRIILNIASVAVSAMLIIAERNNREGIYEIILFCILMADIAKEFTFAIKLIREEILDYQ
jgi:hypothetical protein